MTGETGQLQRLTDEQVKARLAAYNPGGALDADIELLRENAHDIIAEEVATHFGQERADRYASF
jgi:methyl-accepting chemotaxis protein